MQNLMAHSNAIYGTKKLRRRTDAYTESDTHEVNLCVHYIAKPVKGQGPVVIKSAIFR